MRLIGKTAVVTGGASGMGESMCYALANEGASTVAVSYTHLTLPTILLV